MQNQNIWVVWNLKFWARFCSFTWNSQGTEVFALDIPITLDWLWTNRNIDPKIARETSFRILTACTSEALYFMFSNYHFPIQSKDLINQGKIDYEALESVRKDTKKKHSTV